jgi:uncharacterized membrane protein
MNRSLKKHVIRKHRFTRQDLIDMLNNGNGNGRSLTLGQKIADRMAAVGGSWGFIFSFAMFLLTWVAVNSVRFLWAPFDPYPFILLNLILSCLAAIQAPIIMMSQNRLDARDRDLSRKDLYIDIQSAHDVAKLNEKLDRLLALLGRDGYGQEEGDQPSQSGQ